MHYFMICPECGFYRRLRAYGRRDRHFTYECDECEFECVVMDFEDSPWDVLGYMLFGTFIVGFILSILLFVGFNEVYFSIPSLILSLIAFVLYLITRYLGIKAVKDKVEELLAEYGPDSRFWILQKKARKVKDKAL